MSHRESPVVALGAGECFRERRRAAFGHGSSSSMGNGQQVGSPTPRQLFGSRRPPGRDPAMIAAEQHGGNGSSFELPWPGIMRVFEESVLETLLVFRFGCAHDAWQQPHAGVEEHEGSGLAA